MSRIGSFFKTVTVITTIFLSCLHVSNTQCSVPTADIAAQIIPSVYTGSNTATINITEVYINCLAAHAEKRGFYRMSTITAVFNASDRPNESIPSYIDLICFDEAWSLLSSNAYIEGSGRTDNNTQLSCSYCIGPDINFDLPSGDALYHCAPCSSSCLNASEGLGLCTTEKESDCCNFYDTTDRCVSQCGDNQEPNEQFECQCVPFWSGLECNVCNITCQNNGAQSANCSTCICPPGYSGMFCEESINFCDPQPCANNATCVNNAFDFACECQPGYTGNLCDVDVNECEPDPCDNGGTCVDGIADYTCICGKGYTGENCSINIDECEPNPCDNRGTCVDGIADYTCICGKGYTGENCSINIDECEPNPCDNRGTCVDGIADYTCICGKGYTGENCSINIDECEPNPCDNGGTCVDCIASYTCTCAKGYTGENCSINIDECDPNPCDNGGTCVDGIAVYTCMCVEGFSGTDCEININECDPNPCLFGGRCVDRIAGYICRCDDGFTGINCEVNIDECQPNPCVNGWCKDGIGRYTCVCTPGFTGENCEVNINDCLPVNPCLNGGTCNDGHNSYTCSCAGSWFGNQCEICSLRFCDTCSTVEVGLCVQCAQGYVLNEGGECDKICAVECKDKGDLCVFYCELEEWRQTAIRCGMNLPEVKRPKDTGLSAEELWKEALEEQKKFQSVWINNAKNIGLQFQTSVPSGTNPVSKWQSVAKDNVNYHRVWRDYVQMINPDLTFTEFEDFFVDEESTQEELRDIFSSLNDNWSSDLTTYQSNFSSECNTK